MSNSAKHYSRFLQKHEKKHDSRKHIRGLSRAIFLHFQILYFTSPRCECLNLLIMMIFAAQQVVLETVYKFSYKIMLIKKNTTLRMPCLNTYERL